MLKEVRTVVEAYRAGAVEKSLMDDLARAWDASLEEEAETTRLFRAIFAVCVVVFFVCFIVGIVGLWVDMRVFFSALISWFAASCGVVVGLVGMVADSRRGK